MKVLVWSFVEEFYQKEKEYEEKEVIPPIEVPKDKLSSEIIDALIEEFILREGTDYGSQEVSLATKKQQIEKQLEKEEIKIVFDFTTATPTLVTLREFKRICPVI